MRVRWFGQSAFLLTGSKRVFIDPFEMDPEMLKARGLTFDYPPIRGVEADVLLVTHEHADHNGVGVIGGSPEVLRSTAGTRDSAVGQVVLVSSEHDDVAGTTRGPNVVAVFTLDGLRVAHMGDFGQPALRPEQQAAIGEVDVLFVPAGDGPTIGGQRAADVVRAIGPRLVIPMHYRTEAVSFLDPPDAFLDALGARVERLDSSEAEIDGLLGTREAPVVALFAVPGVE
jgi:L-ascorbate metabolism protein UlaG (beta-lactamase superfamily)